MDFKTQSGKTIDEAFEDFHKANPHVYKYFKDYFEMLHHRKSWQKVSGKMIMENLRWTVLTKTNGSEFKLDNNFTSRYIRVFVKEFPQYKKCFTLKSLKS